MVVFTSVAAFLIVSAFQVSWLHIVLLILGGYMVTGASNAFNQVLEKDFDKLMDRTKDRPIAAGRMKLSQGVMYAGFMSLIGITILALFNPLTAFLGMLSLITYSFVYTPLKRYSSIAVLVGAIPGAMPMLIGSVAFQGAITELALMLFAIQLFWQFPHFWAIAKLGFEEYDKAGFNFIPAENNEIHSRVGLQSVLSCAALLAIGVYLAYTSVISTAVLSAISLLAVLYGVESFRFWKEINRKNALRLMFASIIYLPLVLVCLLINQIG